MNKFLQRKKLCFALFFIAVSANAENIRNIRDDFSVDGSLRKTGEKLVGTKTPQGEAEWMSTPTYGNKSLIFSEEFDLVKTGQARVPEGEFAIANGVKLPPMTEQEQLGIELEVTLNKGSFASIVVSSNWEKFFGKASLLKAQIEQNGDTKLFYTENEKIKRIEKRVWWLRKDQAINLKLVYNAKNNTTDFYLQGISSAPDNPERPSQVAIAKAVHVQDGLHKNIKEAGIFVNGSSARLGNFAITLQNARDIQEYQKQQNSSIDDGKILITVEKGKRQTFRGFGANLMGGDNFYGMKPEDHAKLARALWTDLGFNSVRLWHWTWNRKKNYAPNIREFQERYVNNGVISNAKNAGAKTILLTADNFPPEMTQKDEKGHITIRKEYLQDYANMLAGLALEAKKQNNIEINYIGLQNEPGDHDPFRPEDFPPAVKYLRKALNERGLDKIKIIAPESSGVTNNFFKTIELLKADKEAWNALDVIAAHSYDSIANERVEQIIKDSGKPFWMTEASNAPPEDSRSAATMTGLCLNDLNHLANRWMWFIGYSHQTQTSDGGGTGPRMIQFSIKNTPFSYELQQKYYYFQALSKTFDVGSVFRKSVSSKEGRMTWPSKTRKSPAVTACAAKNPDGSWGVAALNYTTGPHTPPDINKEWPWPRRPGHPEKEYEVTVFIEELADKGNIDFSIHECSGDLKNENKGKATMKNGKISFKIKPMHLIVLRSGQEKRT